MGWATPYIEKLKHGETVQFRPRGNSMVGKIESGQLCTVVPVRAGNLNVGDIVLCKVNGFQYLHLIKANRRRSNHPVKNVREGVNLKQRIRR